MKRTAHIQLMAGYNQWMNARLYEATPRLTQAELLAERKAFFGSIIGTLNHLVVADIIWLKRFAAHPAAYPELDILNLFPLPAVLDHTISLDLEQLRNHRAMLDATIVTWANAIEEDQLDQVLHYKNTKGASHQKHFFSLLMHFFNHQTHHRGQVSTLLFQANIDIGVTDLLAMIPNAEVAE